MKRSQLSSCQLTKSKECSASQTSSKGSGPHLHNHPSLDPYTEGHLMFHHGNPGEEAGQEAWVKSTYCMTSPELALGHGASQADVVPALSELVVYTESPMCNSALHRCLMIIIESGGG